MRRKSDNRGASLVMVIITISLIAVFAVIALAVSLNNFKIKIAEQKVDDNFYTAELVLNQVKVGLQNDVSSAYAKAYTETMREYSKTGSTMESRQTEFNNKYVSYLRNTINKSADGSVSGTDVQCSIDRLTSYVDDSLKNSAARGVAKIYPAGNMSGEFAAINTTTNGIVIEDLVVEFTSKDGYFSRIQTDIQLGIPSLNLTSTAGIDDLFNYPLIANGGVDVAAGIKFKLVGSMYSGSLEALNTEQGATSDADFFKSFNVNLGATVDASEAKNMIIDGDLLIKGGNGAEDANSNSTLISDDESQIWARNINSDSAVLKLYGKTYVSDDLTMGGISPVTIIGTDAEDKAVESGQFIGYGDGTAANGLTGASYSSAIILNGKDSTLDLTNASSVVVSGYSYVSTSGITAGADTENKDTLMGNSVAVKGDQIAYLVPAECVGVSKTDGRSKYGKNPITYAEYNDIKQDSDLMYVSADITAPQVGYPLKNYFSNDELTVDNRGTDTTTDDITMLKSSAFNTVFVPGDTGDASDGLVYFYLNLSESMAVNYFQKYLDHDNTRLKRYTDFYTKAIKVPTDSTASIYTAGLYSTFDEDVDNSLAYSRSNATTSSSTGGLLNIYGNLTSKLVEAGVTNEEKSKTVFENIIRTTDTDGTSLKTFLQGEVDRTLVYELDGGKLKCILVDNKSNNQVYTLPTSDAADTEYLVIATGDVVVSKDFTGTVIAGGKASLKSGAVATNSITMKNGEIEKIKRLLSSTVKNKDDVELPVYSFFMDGTADAANGIAGNGVVSGEVQLKDLVTYTNWKKL